MTQPRISVVGMFFLCMLFLLTPLLSRNGRETGPGENRLDVAAETRSPNYSTRLRYPDQFKFRRPIQSITVKPGILPAEDLASASNSLPNELIVKLKPGATNMDELALLLRAHVAGRIDTLNAYRLQFADPAEASAAREQLAANSEVDSVGSNY